VLADSVSLGYAAGVVEAAGAGAHIFSRPFESADGAIEEYLPSAGRAQSAAKRPAAITQRARDRSFKIPLRRVSHWDAG